MDRYLSLKDHVYNYISERINSARLKPGDRISELQVSEELNISRTPVREALIQLASDGYLENLPRKGFRVKSLNIQKARDLYEIIGILDGKAAASCIDILEEEDFSKMQVLVTAMDAAIDQGLGSKYYEMQVEFHDIYLNKCPNREIPPVLNQLKNNFIRKYYVFSENHNEMEVLRETNRQHQEILQLFRKQEAEELESYIRDVHWHTDKAQFDTIGE